MRPPIQSCFCQRANKPLATFCKLAEGLMVWTDACYLKCYPLLWVCPLLFSHHQHNLQRRNHCKNFMLKVCLTRGLPLNRSVQPRFRFGIEMMLNVCSRSIHSKSETFFKRIKRRSFSYIGHSLEISEPVLNHH